MGHPGDAEQGDLSSDLTGAAKREPRTGLGAGGVQGGSRRDPGMEQEGSRDGAGGMQAWSRRDAGMERRIQGAAGRMRRADIAATALTEIQAPVSMSCS